MSLVPNFRITGKIATSLMRIEAAKQAVKALPITPTVLATLRETARLFSTHYSTMIEGNRLTQDQVSKVVAGNQHFPGRERDEKEVLGYYVALQKLEEFVRLGGAVSEVQIRLLHGLVMAGGRKRVAASPYRDGQNVIRDSQSRGIVYMPPEAKDVPRLMSYLVEWIENSKDQELPAPIRAGIAHYEFATIHPYYDGNGRTARLLTTLILHLGGYDLKGLYSLEEYYARDLGSYYSALTVGPSHNYYEGRAKADITRWVAYFCEGMAESFENVKRHAEASAARGEQDRAAALRRLDPRQRKAISLFEHSDTITSRDVAGLFSISERAARNVLVAWVESGFVRIVDAAKKSRKYGVGAEFEAVVAQAKN